MKNNIKLALILPVVMLLVIPTVSKAETIAGYSSYSSSNSSGTTAQYQTTSSYNSSGSTASYSNYYSENRTGSSPSNSSYSSYNNIGTTPSQNYNSANYASVIASQGNYNQTASVANAYPNLPKTGGGGKSQIKETVASKSKLTLWATLTGVTVIAISLFIAMRKNEDEVNMKS